MSDGLRRMAQRNHSALLRGLAEVGQRRVADLIGVSESTVSGMKNDQLERFSALLAACGLKAVPSSERSLGDDHIQALETLAAMALRSGRGESGRDDE